MNWINRLEICIVFSFLLPTMPGSVQADLWKLPKQREYQSTTGKYLLRVTPDKGWPSRVGWCLAELYRREGDQRTLVWKRYLVNNHAPVGVLVADSGQYVITLDEWGEVGQLPVVVYGLKGELLKVHSLESLGVPLHRVKVSVSSVWWRDDSVIFFGPEQKQVFIRPFWGDTLMIDLEHGDLMNNEWYRSHRDAGSVTEESWKWFHAYDKKQSTELALKYLESKDARQRRTGAVVAGQLCLREAIPKLRALQTDDAHDVLYTLPFQSTNDYYVANAARESLEKIGEKLRNTVQSQSPAARDQLR